MKFDKQRATEQMKSDFNKKFIGAVLVIIMFIIIVFAGVIEDKQVFEDLTRPFFKTDKLTEGEIKKYMYYHCVNNTIQWAVDNRDLPNWPESDKEQWFDVVEKGCKKEMDEAYEDMR